MKKLWTRRMLCALLVLGTLGGLTLTAWAQGTQSNPLVSLSYINEKVIPDLLKQVEEKIAQHEKEAVPGEDAAFQTVEVKAGKTVELSAGAQVVLRGGKAASHDLLTDLTDAAGLTGTGELAENHLYLATADGQSIAVSEGATLMVLGGYTVK